MTTEHTISKLGDIWGWIRGKRTRVLLYHCISGSSSDLWSVTPDAFRQQMKWLKHSVFQAISHNRFIHSYEIGQSIPHSVIISFDDGFLDFYDCAMPILMEFDLRAIVFVPTHKLGATGDWSKFTADYRLMDRGHLLELLAHGFEIGSHTANHLSLTDVDDQTGRQDLKASLDYLKTLPGVDSYCLAYPFGRAGAREKDAAMQVGFHSAYLAGGLWGNGLNSDPFGLTRIPIRHDIDLPAFKRIVSGTADVDILLRDGIRLNKSSINEPAI